MLRGPGGWASPSPSLQGCSSSRTDLSSSPGLCLLAGRSASMSPFVRQDVVDGEGHVANVQGQWLVPAGRGHLRGGGRPARVQG